MRGVLTHVSRGTQAPNFVEDIVSRQFQTQLYVRSPPKDRRPHLDRLLALRKKIDTLRKEYNKHKFRLDNPVCKPGSDARLRIEAEVAVSLEQLRQVEKEFWELNVPGDPEERQRQRQQDYLTYRQSQDKGKTACSALGPVSPVRLVLFSQVRIGKRSCESKTALVSAGPAQGRSEKKPSSSFGSHKGSGSVSSLCAVQGSIASLRYP